jgi:uncharacterized protein (UPF0332 family)
MTEEVGDLLTKAKDSLDAARLLLDNGYPEFSASRSYYAMFYAAEALLEHDGLSFSSHEAVISAFGFRYAKMDIVPREMHRHLIEAQALRHVGDYDVPGGVEPKDANEQIDRASRFIACIAQTLGGSL